jgi:hypothetical protein
MRHAARMEATMDLDVHVLEAIARLVGDAVSPVRP